MATIQVNCRFCSQSNAVRKHGKGVVGYQRFRCLDCQRTYREKNTSSVSGIHKG
ncbi:IS1 family transposase [Vibrio lentus]|uniref:IS1 family transposase n=1 Tax=Vibrio lentus TaxID=136468 RepID=UPI0012FFE807|nr:MULTISPECIES: IS1 family transposase [Vibrio]